MGEITLYILRSDFKLASRAEMTGEFVSVNEASLPDLPLSKARATLRD